MPVFSYNSKMVINTCDLPLKIIAYRVIERMDIKALCGYRGERDQNQLLFEGATQLAYPLSKHNKFPSHAIDIVPYPIDWDNLKRFHVMAGYVLGIAESHGIKLTWGGDWDRDFTYKDQHFHDLGHFQLED